MDDLLQKLEIAVLRRNPSLAESFQAGLPAANIRKDLKRAGINGAVEPIIKLYSWRNGTALHGYSATFKAGFELGFVPPAICQLSETRKAELLKLGVERHTESIVFHFVELRKAIQFAKGFKEYAKYDQKLAILVGRYFPVLWDGNSEQIALEIDPSGQNRIVKINLRQDEQPLREAYDSFEDFVNDAIRANENNEPLACIQTLGSPITETSQQCPKPQDNTASTSSVKAATKILETDNILVLRTDFENESAWKSLCSALQDPDNEFSPLLDFVSDQAFDKLTAVELPSSISKASPHPFAFIVDHLALTRSDHPILVVDLQDKPGRAFRVVLSAFADVANNLSIGNMDFNEFAGAADQHGVFRIYQKPEGR